MSKRELRDVFFWSAELDPNDHVLDYIIPADKKRALVEVLESGTPSTSYRGFAMCRIRGCKQLLGTRDVVGHGFRWPDRCAHYVTEHNVWPPGADELLAAAKEES